MFWLLSGIMMAFAMLMLMPSLFRVTREQTDASGDEADFQADNIHLLKSQYQQLKEDVSAEKISQADYQQQADELALQLNDALASAEGTALPQGTRQFAPLPLAAGVALFLLAGCVLVYQWQGSPVFASLSAGQSPMTAGSGMIMNPDGTPNIAAMLAKLEAKLEANPDDLKGWQMYARTNMVKGDYAKAVKGYENVNRLQANDPQVLLQLADAIAMQNNRQITDRAFSLLKQANQLAPENGMGIWLLGMGHRQRGEFSLAIEQWSSLLPKIKEQENKDEILSLINEAKQAQASGKPANNAAPKSAVKKPPTEAPKGMPMKADGTPDIGAMVARLKGKLQQNPDDLKGWLMYGRSNEVLNNKAEAMRAYKQALRLDPSNETAKLGLARVQQ